MKKKILSGILAILMIISVFVPAGNIFPLGTVEASAASIANTVLTDITEVDTYEELKNALEASGGDRIIRLTSDIVANSSDSLTITPNFSGAKVVVDLNGYDLIATSSNSSMYSMFIINKVGTIIFMNSKYVRNNATTVSKIEYRGNKGQLMNILNVQAQCYFLPGITLESDTDVISVQACFRLYFYDVNFNATGRGIYFYEPEKDIFEQSYFALNDVIMETGSYCIDFTGIDEFDDYSMDIDLNHVILRTTTATPAMISNQTQLAPKDLKHAKSSNPIYIYNNGNSTDQILYATLADLRIDRDIAYYNYPYMGSGTACTHSNTDVLLATTIGHVVRCLDCGAYANYTAHPGRQTFTHPTSYGIGYTAGINCSCGYKTYNTIPAVKPPKFFENVIEVSSMAEIKEKAEDSSLSNVTLVLKNDIRATNNVSYTITPKVKGELRLDLNGYDLIVHSNETQYLFDLSYAETAQYGTKLCIADSTRSGESTLCLRSTKKNNAMIVVDNPANSLFIADINIQNGTETDTNVDSYSQTYNIIVKDAYTVTLNNVQLKNYKNNGSNMLFKPVATTTFKNTSVDFSLVDFTAKSYNIDFDCTFSDTTFRSFKMGDATFTPGSVSSPFIVEASKTTVKVGTLIKTNFYMKNFDTDASVDLNSTLTNSTFTKEDKYVVQYAGRSTNCAHSSVNMLYYSRTHHIKMCAGCCMISTEEHTKVDAVNAQSCVNPGKTEYYNCTAPCGYKTEGETIPGAHKITEYKAKAATCSAVGYKESYVHCSLCGLVQVRNENNEVTATYTGAEATAFIASNTIPKNADKHSNRVVYEAKAATCTETGIKTKFAFCSDCGVLAYQSGKTVKTLKGQAAKDFIVANTTAKDPNNHKNLVEYTKKDATCKETGLKESFKFCDACLYLETDTQKLTGDAAMEYYLEASVPVTGEHNYKLVEKKDATCTEAGYKSDFYICDVCNGKFAGEAKTPIDAHEFAKNVRLPAKGHSMEAVTAVEAKCTVEGNIAYYKCTRDNCGKIYSDDKGLTELAASEVVVKATGHTPEEIPGKAATETETGLTVGSKCSVCDEILVAQTEIPKLEAGHKHSYTDVVTAPTCKDKGYTTHTCACGDVKVDTYVDPTDKHTPVVVPGKAPTYENTGLTEGEKCSVCNKVLKEQKVIDKLPLDHMHSYTDTVVAPTCKDKGYTKHVCICGDTYIDTYVEATGVHTPVIVSGKAATTTSAGLTDGEKCSVCDKVLKEQKEIPKISADHKHTVGDWVVVKPAEIGVEGKEQKKCTGCGAVVEERAIPALVEPGDDIMIGDVNKDGKITAADARLALRISATLVVPTDYQRKAADMNGDNKITAADARKILRKSAQLE